MRRRFVAPASPVTSNGSGFTRYPIAKLSREAGKIRTATRWSASQRGDVDQNFSSFADAGISILNRASIRMLVHSGLANKSSSGLDLDSG